LNKYKSKNLMYCVLVNPLTHGIKDSDLAALREIIKKGVPAVDPQTVPAAAAAVQDDARFPNATSASGASLLIAHKGEVVFKEAYGKYGN
jgi:hypothetical protein